MLVEVDQGSGGDPSRRVDDALSPPGILATQEAPVIGRPDLADPAVHKAQIAENGPDGSVDRTAEPDVAELPDSGLSNQAVQSKVPF